MTLLLLVVVPSVALVLGALAVAQRLGYLPQLETHAPPGPTRVPAERRGVAGGTEGRWRARLGRPAPPGLLLGLVLAMVVWILAWLVVLIVGIRLLTA